MAPADNVGTNGRPATRISPSILSADFANLASEVKKVVDMGAQWVHVDIMDGHFVPNLTIGAPVVSSLRHHTDAVLDCHLMVSNPMQWVQDFAKAGANNFTFHLEAVAPTSDGAIPSKEQQAQVVAVAQAVKDAGMQAGIAIKPATPAEALYPYLDREGLIDMVLVLTVEPGFGGQKFMPDVVTKCTTLRQRYPHLDIEVAAAGANVVVAGSAIFGADDPGAVIKSFQTTLDAAAVKATVHLADDQTE